MAFASRLMLAACLPLVACGTPEVAKEPPSLQAVPPSYYRSYVVPQRRVHGKLQPRVIVIERVIGNRKDEPPLKEKGKEIDLRLDAAQRDLDAAVDAAQRRGKKE